MKNRLPIMLTVFPIIKSFGENHSFTSFFDTSITQEGKLASGGGDEGGEEGGGGGREEGEVEEMILVNTSNKTWGS